MHCKNCGKEVNEKAIACIHCGVPPLSERKFCQECGTETKENQVTCVKCGVSLETNTKNTKTNDDKKVGIYRKSEGKILAGVCCGLADRFNVPTALIRVITVFSGVGLFVYIICAMAIPVKK